MIYTLQTVSAEVGRFALHWIFIIVVAITVAPWVLLLQLFQNVYRHVFPVVSLKDRVVVITGAANGIGRSLALDLGDRGAFIIAIDVDKVQLKSLEKECAGLLLAVPTDLTVEADVHKMGERVARLLQERDLKIYAIVNNAGLHHAFDCAASLSESSILRTFGVNVFGTMRVIRELYPLLQKPGGRIINLGSVGGIIGSPYLGAYSASKFAVQGYSETLRREVHSEGVKVVVLNPYFVNTRAHEVLLHSDTPSEKFTKMQLSIEALQDRFMTAEDVLPDLLAALTERWPQASRIVAYPVDRIVVCVLSMAPNWCGLQDFLVNKLQSTFVYEYLRVSSADHQQQQQHNNNKKTL